MTDEAYFWQLEDRSDPKAWSRKALQKRLDRMDVAHVYSAKRQRLVDLSNRFDRGLLSYERYHQKTLAIFCLNRSVDTAPILGPWKHHNEPEVIQILEMQKRCRKDIIKALETADDNFRFRFLDLPAELRVEIYRLHFDILFEAAEQGLFPAQRGPQSFPPVAIAPPICVVSRLLRQEALYEFRKKYRACKARQILAGNVKIAAGLHDLRISLGL
jgi:hypothetical protein